MVSWLKACSAALLLAAAAAAQTATPRTLEYAVKANFLYKFAPFVTWPSQAFGDGGPFQICVAGADPFGQALDRAVRGQRVGPRAIAVRRMARLDGGARCHILFAGGSPEQNTAEMLQAVRGRPVLTVTDGAGGPSGMIRFVLQGGRVRFVVNRAPASEGGVGFSSKLLDLAVAVEN